MTGQTGTNQLSSGDQSLCVALFVASFLLEGLQRCTGVLFSGILELSDETRETASIPFVVSRATAYISSVASKVLSSKTPDDKEESPILYGALLCALGAGLSFISNDVIWLTACWGVLFGTGIGIAFPESLKVSQKFRSQTFFSVLHSASPSFACIVMPFLMQVLLTSYGLSGCLLVLSGIILNAVPFILAAIYKVQFYIRKPKWRIRKKYNMADAQRNGGTTPNNDETASGVINEAFEPENNDIDSKIKTNSSKIHSASVNKSKEYDSPRNTTHHSSDTIYHNLDSHSRNLNKPPQINRNLNLCSAMKTSSPNKTIDEELLDEDVLFEVVSENERIQLEIRKNGNESNSFTTNVSIEDRGPNPFNRKRTVSFPSKHLSIDMDMDDSTSSGNLSTNPSKDFSITKSDETLSCAIRRNFPLEIKVHVVECTLTASDLQSGKININPRKGYRRHSNSLITSSYENVDFTNPQFLKKYVKPSSLCGNLSPRMGLISEDEEYSTEPQSPRCDSNVSNGRQPKTKRCSKFKKLFKPSCLVIIYAYVIYEITLVTLLTIFDDLLPEAETEQYLADSVLPTFGLGGIAGRLSLRYWGDRLLLEGSHATAAVLFILDGVVVAGILWSPNYYWIAGFYTLLGFLEIGILTSVWNLVSDYIDPEIRSVLFTTCTFVCGVCTLCVPYTIGVSRDDLGEYDALLQVTSALPVLCALLCYILPRFATHSKRVRGS